jgi:hypothetical protein
MDFAASKRMSIKNEDILEKLNPAEAPNEFHLLTVAIQHTFLPVGCIRLVTLEVRI